MLFKPLCPPADPLARIRNVPSGSATSSTTTSKSLAALHDSRRRYGRSAAPLRFMYVCGLTRRTFCARTRPAATRALPSFRQPSKRQTSARWSINHQPTL
jgi:hypothetical protein